MLIQLNCVSLIDSQVFEIESVKLTSILVAENYIIVYKIQKLNYYVLVQPNNKVKTQ